MALGRRLIAAGIAALVIGLLLTFPARVAYHWFAPDEVALSGITGSVWSGRAAEGSVAALYFRNLSWRFHPTSLFRLQAGFSLTADLPGGFVNTRIALAGGGVAHFSDLSATVPLAAFNAFSAGSDIGGSLNLQFERLVLEDGLPTVAEGTATVSGLLVPALSPAPLGDYRALLQTSDDGVSGTFEDLDGVLDLEGSMLFAGGRSYSFVGRVAATADSPASVHEQLRFLGSADPQGRREFRFEGTL